MRRGSVASTRDNVMNETTSLPAFLGCAESLVLLRKFSLSQSELSDVRNLLTEAIREIRQAVDPIKPVSRDPDDDKVLACASASGADYLVTGDEDLLVIKWYGGTKILAPRDFEGLFVD